MLLVIEYPQHIKSQGLEIKKEILQTLDEIFRVLLHLNQDILKRINKIWILLPKSQLKYLKNIEIKFYLNDYFDPEHKYFEIEKVIKKLMRDAEYLYIDENKIESKRNILKDNDVAFFSVVLSPTVFKLLINQPNLMGFAFNRNPNKNQEISDPNRYLEIAYEVMTTISNEYNQEQNYFRPQSLLNVFGMKYEKKVREKFNASSSLFIAADDSYIRKRILQALITSVDHYYLNSENEIPIEFPESYNTIIIDNIHDFDNHALNLLNSRIIEWHKRKKSGKVILSGKEIELIPLLDQRFNRVPVPSQEEIEEKFIDILLFFFSEAGIISESESVRFRNNFTHIFQKIKKPIILFENIPTIIRAIKENYEPEEYLSISVLCDIEKGLISTTTLNKNISSPRIAPKIRKIIFKHKVDHQKHWWIITGIPGIDKLPYGTSVVIHYLVCIIQKYNFNKESISESDLVNIVIKYKNKRKSDDDLRKRLLNKEENKQNDIKRIESAFTGKSKNPIDPSLKDFIKKHINKTKSGFEFIDSDVSKNEKIECEIIDENLTIGWFDNNYIDELRDSLNIKK